MSARYNETLIANSYHCLWEQYFAKEYNKKILRFTFRIRKRFMLDMT
jgi:hypothetical protein